MTDTPTTLSPQPAQAPLAHGALLDETTCGRIVMRGRDRAALLHRLSTNDIERLKPGQGTQTVLTTPIGRIIDLLTIHAREDSLLLVTSPGQGPTVFSHLKKNIFFNDQVTLEPAGRTLAQIALVGPQAKQLLQGAGAPALDDLALHAITPATIAGAAIEIARRKPIGGQGFTLYIPAEAAAPVHDALVAAGAAVWDAGDYDVARIEAGIPAFGKELSQEYIPLETGLLDAVSFSKGCYVGQEIIARMESRGRLAKQLRGLRLLDLDEERDVVALAGTQLQVEGKEAGDLTSAVRSARFGPIALAYVRSAHAEPGTIVGVVGDLRGEVVELPFR